MGELPEDVSSALLKCAMIWILQNYSGGNKKLINPDSDRGHYAYLLNLRSWSLADSRPKNLRRLRRLVSDGLLIERPHYRKDRGSCDFTVPSIEQANAIYDRALAEWQSKGYVIGEMMPEILGETVLVPKELVK